jgi:FeS assembly SUF system protein
VIPRDVFERKRLKVLNAQPPKQASASEYVLEDDAFEGFSTNGVDAAQLREEAVKTLRTIKDPEIPLNIYDLGLIYGLAVDDAGAVSVSMTLTSPGCPVAGVLVGQVHDKLRRVPGVSRVRTELVWDPPWSKDRLDEAARLALDLF